MMNSKILRNFLYIIISVVISFFIYRFITIRLIDFLPFVINNPIPFYIIIVLFQAIIIYIILNGIQNNELDNKSKKMLWIQYFIVVIFLLFGRNIGSKGVELNLFIAIKDWFSDSFSIVITIANFLMFIPLSFFFRNKNLIYSILSIIGIVFCIEIAQYLLSLGILDVGDILLNCLGFLLGRLFFKSKLVSKYERFLEINKK